MFWKLLAWICSPPPVADWLIRRAQLTPYDHLATDGKTIFRLPSWTTLWPGHTWYMRRWWLCRNRWFEARIHNIQYADLGRDQHNHPWPFRTVILRGGYNECQGTEHFTRTAGDTYTLQPDQFHQIWYLPTGEAWTLFITFGRRGSWGFKTPAGVVDRNEYNQ